MKDVIETPHLCVRSRFLPPVTDVLGHLDQPNPPVAVLKVQVPVRLLAPLARPGPIAGHHVCFGLTQQQANLSEIVHTFVRCSLSTEIEQI